MTSAACKHCGTLSVLRGTGCSMLLPASDACIRQRTVLQGMQLAVASALHKQLASISYSLHASLSEANDPMLAAKHAMSVSLSGTAPSQGSATSTLNQHHLLPLDLLLL